MKFILFTQDLDLPYEWKKKYNINNVKEVTSKEELLHLTLQDDSIILADYDSVATDVNKLIASNKLPKNFIVLEKAPQIVTGKALISRGVKAYGNARMLPLHFTQMIQTVQNSKVWTYPELTASLVQHSNTPSLNPEAQQLLDERLTKKEKEVVYLILEGLTNDAIATKLNTTTRTIKAHITSIFQKLHINDRLSLVLLLK